MSAPTSSGASRPAGQEDGAHLDATAARAAVDRFLETFFRLHPVTASFAGVRDHDHVLPDFSPEGLADARDERSRLRRALAEAGVGVIHPEDLSRREWLAIDGAVADACLELQLAEDESRHFVRGNPSLAVGEALFSLVALATSDHGPVEARVEAAVARMKAFPVFLDGARRTIGEGPLPSAWRERAVRECEAGEALLADLAGWPVGGQAPVTLCREFQEQAAHASAALDWFRAFVAGRADAPEVRHAAGAGLLGLLVRRGHWCDRPVDSLRHEARASLEREQQHLRERLREAGERDWREVAERLTLQRPAPDDVVMACHVAWRDIREAAAGALTWPGIPFHYVPMPAWARRAAPGLYYLLYRSPAPLALPSADRCVVPVPDDDADAAAREAFARGWHHVAIRLNHVAHHGGPGHHVQNWHAARSPSRIGRIAAVDGACRIAMFAGGSMAEGWACYATELLEEIGVLSADERLSLQHTRVRLATRAVVDLELHSGRLTFDEAVRLHEEHAGLSPAAARSEVTKCSMFPGTAMMYWLGVRELWRLRTDEEAARGVAFDEQGFHDRVLEGGSLPLPLVSRLVAAARP